MVKIVISSGHGRYVRGASGILDEVTEARRVVEAVAEKLRGLNVEVITYHDDVSTTQEENLERIVDFHNAQGPHDLDVSCHFNAYTETASPMGTEVLYITQAKLADDMSSTIAAVSGLIDRGPKLRDDLYFLNNTNEPSILIETCFVDSEADARIYNATFDRICWAIAGIAADKQAPERPQALFTGSGSCSWFGGPDDTGVSPSEGLAFLYEYDDAPHLFLSYQPEGTTGLARRLDADKRPYVACRWDYNVTPKTMLADPHQVALVRSKRTGKEAFAWPSDWGPHEDTDRIADLSPYLMEILELTTDDDVEVIYPFRLKQVT
jgi:N-acetylmuramoyl-L-alanine amidase